MNENDRMLNPDDGTIWQIDDRLLQRDTWLNAPLLVSELLTQLRAATPATKLTDLATQFLEMVTIPFKTPPIDPRNLDFVLVLGNALDANAAPSPELLGRLEIALQFWQANPFLRIVTSGGGETKGLTEAQVMRDWLVTAGVHTSSVIMENKSRDTVENMVLSVPLLVANGARSICLITGEAHMPRSFLLLNVYCKQNALSLEFTHSAYGHKSTFPTNHQIQLERFLLFKDLGRIQGIWDYQNYSIPRLLA